MAEVFGQHNGVPEERHMLPGGAILQQRYQIQRVLGQGGFGITYHAWDHARGEPVALKEFYPQSIVTRDCMQGFDVQCVTQQKRSNFQAGKTRFLREANALQRFRDVRSIVDIRDYFESNNTAYIVMEYLVGRDLRHFVNQRGSLTVEETLRILEPVFHALTVVHQAGLVHRDISPDNIMLENQRGAKLLDFGAVRSVEDPSVDSPLSKSTEAILKHGFAPIEQYSSRGSLGPWTDEYALCATIYYCLTGQVPVQPSFRISDKIEPEWERISGLTEGQRAALKKGMAIAPSDRFPDVGSLYEALYHGGPIVTPAEDRTVPAEEAPVVTEPVVPVTGQRPGKAFKTVVIVMLSLLLAALLGIGGWLIYDTVSDSKGREGGGAADDGPSVSAPQKDPVPPTQGPDTEPAPETRPEPETEPETEPADTAWIDNVMVSEPLDLLLQNDPEENDITDYRECRKEVRTISFWDHLDDAPAWAIHLGENGSNKVVGWCVWNGEYADIHIAAEGGINASRACRNLFAGCESLLRIDFNGAFHTEGCEDMKWMFYYCYSLTELDLSSFDTSNVVMMQAMFRECGELTEIDVSSFDTSKVFNMAQMFSTCSKLEYIDLSNFDTSSLENMSYMFSANRSLRSVDVSSFDTSRVTNMEGVFNFCGQLEDMPLSWDVSSVNNHVGFMIDGKTINGRPWQEYFS